MLSLADKIRASKLCCQKAADYFTAKKRSIFDKLHDSRWEVFVIKKDEQTGELTWKTACCIESLG
jgi:hypothetical protein